VKEKEALLREEEYREATQGEKFVVPNFTVKQLLDAIPAHCFHRSAIRSSLYIVQDVAAIALLVYAAFHIDSFLARFNLSTVPYYAAKISLYATYQVVASFFRYRYLGHCTRMRPWGFLGGQEDQLCRRMGLAFFSSCPFPQLACHPRPAPRCDWTHDS